MYGRDRSQRLLFRRSMNPRPGFFALDRRFGLVVETGPNIFAGSDGNAGSDAMTEGRRADGVPQMRKGGFGPSRPVLTKTKSLAQPWPRRAINETGVRRNVCPI